MGVGLPVRVQVPVRAQPGKLHSRFEAWMGGVQKKPTWGEGRRNPCGERDKNVSGEDWTKEQNGEGQRLNTFSVAEVMFHVLPLLVNYVLVFLQLNFDLDFSNLFACSYKNHSSKKMYLNLGDLFHIMHVSLIESLNMM